MGMATTMLTTAIGNMAAEKSMKEMPDWVAI